MVMQLLSVVMRTLRQGRANEKKLAKTTSQRPASSSTISVSSKWFLRMKVTHCHATVAPAEKFKHVQPSFHIDTIYKK
jgi:CRISPR/Cas system-associated protein endoribonuclease Cas2